MITKIALTVSILFSIFLIGCKTETPNATHNVSFLLERGKRQNFENDLAYQMKKLGFTRRNTDSGLNELQGRSVLFYWYESKDTVPGPFLTANDIKKEGIVEINIYATFFKDEVANNLSINAVSEIIFPYGVKLQTVN